MIVVGLDLSLTSTGIARTYADNPLGPDTIVDRVTSTGKETATLLERDTRLTALRKHITALALPADLAVVEGPSYASKNGKQHDRSGLWWAVVRNLMMNGVPVVEVPPSSRMKYATGKGNAAKDAVLAAVVRRYPDVEVTGNDEADALVLAAMGARHLGHPIDDLPKTHLAAMDAVRWPARTGA